MNAASATGEGSTTYDGSARTTQHLLGRIHAALGRLTGNPPPPERPEDTEPRHGAEDDEA